MKIALLAPIEETVPPTRYGGTEWVVYYLAHYLGKKGHTVDVYGAGDSKREPYYNLIPCVPKSIRTIPIYFSDLKLRETKKYLTLAHVTKQLMAKDYDIVHNHYGWRFLIFADFISPVKIVTTHHGPLSFGHQNEVFLQYKDKAYISISNNQRRDLPNLNYAATIYNGVDTKLFSYKEQPNQSPSYMLFLARMNEEKGAIEAAKASLETKHPLKVAAKVDHIDQPYFEKFKPLIDNQYISFLGEIDRDKRLDLLQNARLLIAPVKWEEPFGLMFIEAMATGTPVVAFSRGAVPEVIKDGETGFIVNQEDKYNRGNWIVKKTGIEGLREAIERIYSMPQEQYLKMRQACRAHVEKNFTVERMVNEYEKVYEQVLKK